MLVNSSFVDFFPDTPHLSPNSSHLPLACWDTTVSVLIFTSFSVTNILLMLPLYALVLCFGFQRWRRQRSGSTTATTSHSDVFTYHMVAMEMVSVLGSLLYCVGAYADLPEMKVYGLDIFFAFWSVKVQFHVLTCVECYLAVVRPVTYLGLKNKGGVRIRNTSTGCIWLLCVIWWILVVLTGFIVCMIMYFCLVAFALIINSFCCIFVLRTLLRPGPGEAGGGRVRVNQSKQRAFHTTVTIMGVQLFCLGGMLLCDALEVSLVLTDIVGCAVMTCAIWFSLPNSLVLPLLFLQRAGKLPGCKH